MWCGREVLRDVSEVTTVRIHQQHDNVGRTRTFMVSPNIYKQNVVRQNFSLTLAQRVHQPHIIIILLK